MFKLAALILCAFLATTYATNIAATNSHIAGRADTSLANFILARTGAASTPASMQCFTIYLPLLQASSDQWAADYQKCLNTSDTARNIVLDRASQEQKNISTDAASVCNYIQSCDAINDALTAIDCFSALTSNTLSTIYTVSNNASDVASIIRQEINNIEIDLNRCTNASERAYVERSARIYDALDVCLKYGPPPTVAPPTTTTTTTITTTETPSPTVPTPESEGMDLISMPRRSPLARSSLAGQTSDDTDLSSMLKKWLKQNGGRAEN